MPKTAGSSFLPSLEEHYGSSLLKDYSDIPINTSTIKRNSNALKMCILNGIQPKVNIRCIHGYFLPLKCLFFSSIGYTFD
jgi:hypothetical protein